MPCSLFSSLKDLLHNSCEPVAVGSGWAARRLLAAYSSAITKKNNAVDRPSPAEHRSQRVMQRVLKRLAIACSFAMAVTGAGANPSAAAADATAPPAFVRQALAGAAMVGEGQMRLLGLRIYSARLWVGPQFEAVDFGSYPLALELTYHRAFTGAAIAQRSIEEIERQGRLVPAQAQRWQKAAATNPHELAANAHVRRLLQPLKHGCWHLAQALPDKPVSNPSQVFVPTLAHWHKSAQKLA